MQPQGCNTKKREPREEPGHGDGCPSPAGVQACSQTFPTSTSPLHSTQSLLAARNYGGSSWSSLDCGLAVSRPGEHLRKWRGQQARDSETPWEGTACAAVQQRLERVQGVPGGIFPHSCGDPQHYTPLIRAIPAPSLISPRMSLHTSAGHSPRSQHQLPACFF